MSTLNPILFTDEIKHKIIGHIIKMDLLEALQTVDESELIMFHHDLGQWIRNTFIWNAYDDNDSLVHPDDISYEWIVAVKEYISSEEFNKRKWIDLYPQLLV